MLLWLDKIYPYSVMKSLNTRSSTVIHLLLYINMAGPKVLLSGSCRCGTVTYTSSSLPIELGNCYCFTCRKLGGSAFLTFIGFLTSSITWTSGLNSFKKTSYSDIVERAHCLECGSPIYMIYYHRPEHIGILAGTIDEESMRGELAKLNYCQK